jgi:hypothetical protein
MVIEDIVLLIGRDRIVEDVIVIGIFFEPFYGGLVFGVGH